MRYIVIGGSGFVGRYTLSALAQAMQNSRIVRGEIINLDLIDGGGGICKARPHQIHRL